MISNIDLTRAAVFAPIVAAAADAAFRVDLAHHIPGRLRLRSADLKGNPRASEEARRDLAQIGGVTSATVNPSTGSILLEYDPKVIPPSEITDVLASHGYALRATDENTEAGTDWTDKLATAAKDCAMNALAERLALAVIGALV